MSGPGDPIAVTPRQRPAAARARAARHGIVATEAFSRGDAIDRDWMGWGALRVLSRQDWAPGATRDDGRVANMERLLLVLEGALDADCGALGQRRVEAGGALWIGSGHGTWSRLANASHDAQLQLVELWLQPDRVNAVPTMAAWSARERDGEPCPGAAEGWALLPVRQRVTVMTARVEPGERLGLPDTGGARCWLEVLAGDVVVADAAAMEHGMVGTPLASGDGLAWIAGAAGSPVSLAACGGIPARLLLLALPA